MGPSPEPAEGMPIIADKQIRSNEAVGLAVRPSPSCDVGQEDQSNKGPDAAYRSLGRNNTHALVQQDGKFLLKSCVAAARQMIRIAMGGGEVDNIRAKKMQIFLCHTRWDCRMPFLSMVGSRGYFGELAGRKLTLL